LLLMPAMKGMIYAGKQAQFDRRELAMNKLILRYEKHYGLLYFTSKTCEYCRISLALLCVFQ
jgi:thioredoxin-related protein